MPGLIFVVALYTFPFAYIMVVNTIELIASDMEEAAAILGASRVWVALTITLPMVLPAIVSGFILSVLQALAVFGSPAILALPAGFHTITTQIWALFQYPPKMEMAAAFSMPLLLATALLLFAQKRILGRRGYAAVGGKGGQRRRIPLGRWRYPALGGCLAVMACAVFLPYGMLAKAAFARAWVQPLTGENVTLANWSLVFMSTSTRAAIVNTLELGLLTASIGAALAALLAYVTSRKLIAGHQILAFLVLTPVVIPGVVLAVGLFIAYTRPPFLLYGTLWILFLAYLTKELPVGYSQSDATFRGIYEAPSSRFVAEFIGKTNLVEGRAEDADTFTRRRLRIRLDGAVLSPGAPTILSIRPHQIELRPVTSDNPARPTLGELRGAVLRASYLGDGVDYQVEVADSDVVLRVAGPAAPRLRAGDAVWLRVLRGRALPPDA